MFYILKSGILVKKITMAVNPRKYLNAVEAPYPHMGELLRKRIQLSGMTGAEVARKLSISNTTIARYFNNSSLQAGILWNVGMAIKHNFFSEMGKLMPMPFHDPDAQKTSSDSQEQLAACKEKINDLEKELAIYKAIVLRDTPQNP
jgi:transcriptional regulator with XRE-family HTH domain